MTFVPTYRRCLPWVVLVLALGMAATIPDTRTRGLMRNTLLYAGSCTAMATVVGTTIALLLFRCQRSCRVQLAMLLTLMVLPAYLQVSGWDAGFGFQGWWTRMMASPGATPWIKGWTGAVAIQSIVAIPWVTMIVGLGLNRIPRELEQCASLSASDRQVIWHITLPLAQPSIVAASLLTFVMSANEITITDVYQIRTFAEEIYTGFALGDELIAAQLRALPGSLLLGAFALAAMLSCRELVRPGTWQSEGPKWVVTPHWTTRCASCVATIAIFLAIAVPIGNLLYKAGMEVSSVGDQHLRSWSIAKTAKIMVDSGGSRFLDEFAWSAILGQLAALTVLVGSLTLAWSGKRWPVSRAIGWTLLLVGIAIPGPVLALGLGRLLNHPESEWLMYLYDQTLLLPWAAISLRAFPFGFLIAIASVNRIHRQLLENAATDGANPFRTFRHLVVPQMAPTAMLIWLVAFVISLGDLSASILATPPGVTTVAIRIFNLVHYGVEDQLAGLCLVSTICFLFLTWIMLRVISIASSGGRREV